MKRESQFGILVDWYGREVYMARKVVFFGSPAPAGEGVLRKLVEQSSTHVSAVVTQPAKRAGRGRSRMVKSGCEEIARELGFSDTNNSLLTPESANDGSLKAFLYHHDADLCITAAYGMLLPEDVLLVPRHGIVNVHPSLLPQLRGASPVARALEHGMHNTGVSLAYTVRKMDAGPVIAQSEVQLHFDDDTPSAMQKLFHSGGDLLLAHMEHIVTGKAREYAAEQDERLATRAPKLSKHESILDFNCLTAMQAHNKVRAFRGWPGTSATFSLCDSDTGEAEEDIQLKILRTRPPLRFKSASFNEIEDDRGDHMSDNRKKIVQLSDDESSLTIPCADGRHVEVLEVQPPSKKAMEPKAFMNGLKGKLLKVKNDYISPSSISAV